VKRMAVWAITGPLLVAGMLAAQSVQMPQDAEIQHAVERSLPLLQKSGMTSIQKSRCISCHHNSLTAMTVALARNKGVRVDDRLAREQLEAAAQFADDWRVRLLNGFGIAGGADAVSYLLLGLGADDHPADPATDLMALFLKQSQQPDGRWRISADRPPVEYSDVTVTATALQALQLYAPESEKLDYDMAVRKAGEWIFGTTVQSSEEHAFRLLAMTWANAPAETIRSAAEEARDEQKSDGGWSQLSDMSSDVYATGQMLVALNAAGLAADDDAYRRGIQFLLDNQLDDGSWHVTTRSFPLQPYFETDFPHGDDQWISAAASNWATMALLHSLP
jgi:hypothetical protein